MLQTMKTIWRLGLPLCLTFVMQMIIIMVDSAFAGNISYSSLAAVSLASNTFYIFLLLVIGVGIACGVKAGQAFGADNLPAMLNSFRQGTFLGVLLGVVLAVLLLNCAPIMRALGQPENVIIEMKPYLMWFAWTLPIQALTVLYRTYFAVIDKPWAGVWPVLYAVLLNAFLDYCLANGNLGFPAMGIAGIGLASLISNLFLLLMMLRNIGWVTVRSLFDFMHQDVWVDQGIWKLLIISLPISLTLVSEEAFFAGSAYLAGYLGAEELAAHQILLNTAGTSYLFNMGISTACSILIGKYIGAGKLGEILTTVKAGWLLVMIFTIPFALLLLVLGDNWISLFLDKTDSSNQATILFVKSALMIVVLMLFIDATWLVIIESLHGMLDTAFPMWCTVIAYWLIGGPLAYWAIGYFPNAFVWIWIAMLIAACVLTALVFSRLFYKLKQYKVSPV